jgi:hypothetical protein
MRLMLVYYLYPDAGSAIDVHHYVRAAKELGHEIVVYGPPQENSPFPWSLDLESVDGLVFVFEWTQQLLRGGRVDLARMIAKVPRSRRIVIDCDGGYNARMDVEGDQNHKTDEDSRKWLETADCLADKIFQPTPRPRRPNVKTFFFHGYSESWERPLDLGKREYGMAYVGHSKFRWKPMERVLDAIAPVRNEVGRLAIVGHGWDKMPEWAPKMGIENQFWTDTEKLARMGVEFVPPCHFSKVIDWMSSAVFNPVIYRPLFADLSFVTCRTFETPAAGTIPLFGLDEAYVREIFGEAALELVLPKDRPEEKIRDMFERRTHYASCVEKVRAHMRTRHDYEGRVRQLVDLVSADS